MKIVFFIIFIASYIASLVLVRMLQVMANGYSAISSTIVGIVAQLFFFFYLWLLSGFWNLPLMIAFIGLGLAGALASQVLWAISGPDEDDNYFDQMMYFSAETGMRNPRWMIGLFWLLLLYVVIFPILIGYVYFSSSTTPEEMTQSIIKYAATLNVLMGIVSFSFPGFTLLASRNTNEGTRSAYIIMNLSALFTIVLWIALFLWSFNLTFSTGYSISTGSTIEFKISPLFLGIVFGVLGLILFVPYLMGSQSGKKWNIRLLQLRKKLVVQLINILNDPELEMPALHAFAAKIENEKEKFWKKNPTIEVWTKIDDLEPNQLDANQTLLVSLFEKCRESDVRFQHLDFLSRMQKDVQRMIAVFQNQNPPVTERYVKNYEYDEKGLTEEIKAQESFNPQMYAAIFFLVSAVISQVYSSFSQWALALFNMSSG